MKFRSAPKGKLVLTMLHRGMGFVNRKLEFDEPEKIAA